MPTTASARLPVQISCPSAGPRVRVLVVDDDPLVMESLRAFLDSHPDIEACGFTSAEEAISGGGGRSFDVCLLDFSLGKLNGVMLGAMIRAINPAARLILMSGALSPSIERQALGNGFDRILPKPFPPGRLTELLLDWAVD